MANMGIFAFASFRHVSKLRFMVSDGAAAAAGREQKDGGVRYAKSVPAESDRAQ